MEETTITIHGYVADIETNNSNYIDTMKRLSDSEPLQVTNCGFTSDGVRRHWIIPADYVQIISTKYHI